LDHLTKLWQEINKLFLSFLFLPPVSFPEIISQSTKQLFEMKKHKVVIRKREGKKGTGGK
jgi:glucose-6-phosphate 1-dehydrogenase